MNNGLTLRAGDLGRLEVTQSESDRGKFKVPSLRNVALTAPYMHDGRFVTLEEVIEHYNGPMHRSPTLDPNLAKHPEAGLGLNAEDKAALVAFLKTLTDEQFVSPEPFDNQLSQTR
jgi:cytochrome c peroxidase